jgi:hypothetical protein
MPEETPINHSINRTHVELWKIRELYILEQIDKTGKERKPEYKYPCLSRYCNYSLMCICSATLCAPLVLWDLIGCTCFNCCRIAYKHGAWIDAVYYANKKTNTDVHQELRETIATSVNIRMYSNEVIGIIYDYIKFYNNHKISSPYKAEIARKELVSWASLMYHACPPLLKINDSSSIDDIIEAIHEYRLMGAPTYQNMI